VRHLILQVSLPRSSPCRSRPFIPIDVSHTPLGPLACRQGRTSLLPTESVLGLWHLRRRRRLPFVPPPAQAWPPVCALQGVSQGAHLRAASARTALHASCVLQCRAAMMCIFLSYIGWNASPWYSSCRRPIPKLDEKPLIKQCPALDPVHKTTVGQGILHRRGRPLVLRYPYTSPVLRAFLVQPEVSRDQSVFGKVIHRSPLRLRTPRGVPERCMFPRKASQPPGWASTKDGRLHVGCSNPRIVECSRTLSLKIQGATVRHSQRGRGYQNSCHNAVDQAQVLVCSVKKPMYISIYYPIHLAICEKAKQK
jgi:hypothetical protein